MSNFGLNPFAHLMPSERDAKPELNTVNENGEVMVKIGTRWFTQADAEIERQDRHDYCQKLRDQRESDRLEGLRQYEAEEQSFKNFMNGSAYDYDYSNSTQTQPTPRKQTEPDPLGWGDVVNGLVVAIVAAVLYFVVRFL